MSPASTTTATATVTPHALRRRLGFALFARAGTEQDSKSGRMMHAREESGSPTTEHYSESEGTDEEDEVENSEELDEDEDNGAEMADPSSMVDEDEDDGATTPRAQDHTTRSPSVDSLESESSSKRTRPSIHVPPSSSSTQTQSDEERRSQFGDIDDADEDPELNLTKRAWYSFDISVVLALISPIGNWLTGGDYVKNVLLLLFLLYYLHQIIEIPWSLYQSARPRRPSRRHVAASLPSPASAVASSELRLLEFFFLALTVSSPFVGVHLLKRGASAALGPDAISWFSTTLFILATGVRPWMHLITRLRERTTALHDAIHYPASNHPGRESAKLRVELIRLSERVDQIASSLDGITGAVKTAARSEEVYDHVDDALDAVEAALRANERRGAAQRATADARFEALELALEALTKQHQHAQERVVYVHAPAAPPTLSMWVVGWLPGWMAPPQKRAAPKYYGPTNGQTAGRSPRSPTRTMKLRLETIPEDAPVDVREPPAYGDSQAFPSWPRAAQQQGKRKADPYGRWEARWWWSVPGVSVMFRLVEVAVFPLRAGARVVGLTRA